MSSPFECLSASLLICGVLLPTTLIREIALCIYNDYGLYKVETSQDFEDLMIRFQHTMPLVMFTMDWCTYCRKTRPILERTAWQSRIPFVQFRNPDVVAQLKFSIEHFPTIVRFADGKITKTFLDGLRTEAAIQEFADNKVLVI